MRFGWSCTVESKGRVLVVEDDAPVRELLELHLANEGYEVLCAADAIEAGYAILETPHAFALLIVDAQLPHLSGIELVSTLIADSSVPPIPMILISGHEDLLAHAEAIGVPCLRKPFFADALIRLVEQTRAEAGPPMSTARASDAGVKTKPMRAGAKAIA